jgi:hypothetical protein
MAQTLKIGILRGRHVPAAIALTPALEQACREMLVESANPPGEAVLQYWTECTDGEITFAVTLLPWVDVTFTPADVSPNGGTGIITRNTSFNKVQAATAALSPSTDFTQFDGFICLVAPGTNVPNPAAATPGQPPSFPLDGGSSGRGQKGAFAVYPIATSPHTFMCHEFGHVLGLFDDDGLAFGPGGSTGYGDPLDIMSALAFAGSSPMFSGTPVPNWPNANAKNQMGPAPSRAVVHYWNPAAQRPAYVTTLAVPGGATPTVRLYAAYGTVVGPHLVIIEPDVIAPNSIGRTYLEYRDIRNWDRGLATTGQVLDRRGVAAHVAALRPAPDLGAGDLIGNRCFYRGEILIPVETDSDMQVSGSPWTVRVLDADVEEGWVDLQVSRSSPSGFQIGVAATNEVAGPEGPIEETRTPCGDTLHHGTWLTVGHAVFTPVTWGLGGTGSQTGGFNAPPTVQWTVGGVAVPSYAPSGTLSGCKAPEGLFNVVYTVDAAQALRLSTTTAGDKYEMTVGCTATDTATLASVSAQATFAPHGRFTGIPLADQFALVRCLRRIVAVFPPDLGDLRLGPDQPHPNWGELIARLLDRPTLQDRLFAFERDALRQLADLPGRLRQILR